MYSARVGVEYYVVVIPELFELFCFRKEFLVESALQLLVVRYGLLQLRAKTVGCLGLFIEASVHVVEINLKVGQLNRELVPLLRLNTSTFNGIYAL